MQADDCQKKTLKVNEKNTIGGIKPKELIVLRGKKRSGSDDSAGSSGSKGSVRTKIPLKNIQFINNRSGSRGGPSPSPELSPNSQINSEGSTERSGGRSIDRIIKLITAKKPNLQLQ